LVVAMFGSSIAAVAENDRRQQNDSHAFGERGGYGCGSNSNSSPIRCCSCTSMSTTTHYYSAECMSLSFSSPVYVYDRYPFSFLSNHFGLFFHYRQLLMVVLVVYVVAVHFEYFIHTLAVG